MGRGGRKHTIKSATFATSVEVEVEVEGSVEGGSVEGGSVVEVEGTATSVEGSVEGAVVASKTDSSSRKKRPLKNKCWAAASMPCVACTRSFTSCTVRAECG